MTPINKTLVTLLFLLPLVSLDIEAQTSWQKYSDNPVLHGSGSYGIYGDFDQYEALHPFVIEENGYYRMWYVGVSNSYSVGEAISPDGIFWYTLRGNPRLTPGPSGSFDASGIRKISVVRDHDGYKMYYYSPVNGVNKIGMAYSPDGHSWTKHPGNPVLEPGSQGSWDDAGVWAPMVLYENNGYKMWYQGTDGTVPEIGFASVGYATSSDGIHWTKHENNPVVSHGSAGEFDYYTAGEPFVLHLHGRYHMFYTSTDASIKNKIGYAFSRNGITWTKFRGNPVLTSGPSSWDGQGVAAASVIFKDNEFKMFYVGWGGGRAIGLATAERNMIIKEPGTFFETQRLLETYPNPFNPTTTVHYKVTKPGQVRINIYDILGREVETLINETKAIGDYSIEWNAQIFASGKYFCRMINDDITEVRELTLLK
ncbi:MAG: T9SS type A sorting domain-containing protein [Ignavibacteriae bacterium]|nr:T9SS type A sorting domain-containing protein [Ignavibacteriota bacterium]